MTFAKNEKDWGILDFFLEKSLTFFDDCNILGIQTIEFINK